MMRNLVCIAALFFWFGTSGLAQNLVPRQGGKLEAYKIAYITNKLNLSSEEAQKFWPIYNKYVSEIRQVQIQNTGLDEIELEEKVVSVRKKYKNEFGQALPTDKVNQFFKIDKDFNNSVRKELNDRRDLKQMRQQNKRSF